MFFRQFYLQGLGHASYLVGSEKTGEALVFDPQRDVSSYFGAARMQGLRIPVAADSHGHNDYLSGLSELAQRTEVQLWGSAEADLGYGHRPLHDGEQIEFGEVGVQVLHTPEHLSLLIYDTGDVHHRRRAARSLGRGARPGEATGRRLRIGLPVLGVGQPHRPDARRRAVERDRRHGRVEDRRLSDDEGGALTASYCGAFLVRGEWPAKMR